MEKQLRKKGKFIKKKQLMKSELSAEKLRIYNASRKAQCPPEENEDTTPVTPVIRIVDINVLAKSLKCKWCDKVLSLENRKHEVITGLMSTFTIQCNDCLKLNAVPTSATHVVDKELCPFVKNNQHNDQTTKAVSGTINAGIGYTQLNKILACLGIRPLNSATYQEYLSELGPHVEAAAEES